jgi:IS4 transposase
MKGRLLIFDLGFYRALLFREIDRHGGYFLCRMKKDGNPTVLSSYRGRCRNGIKLRTLQQQTDDTILDVEAEMVYQQRHKKRPFATNHTVQWRCVAVYNAQLGQWHRYVTNMPPAMMKAEHFTAVYAARWEVELLFRELKCSYRLEHLPSASQHVTETLIYAALLTLVLSRRLHRTLTRRWRVPDSRLPFDRWAVLVATLAHDLLDVALSRHDRTYRQRRIECLLRAEALDPNRNRHHLIHKAQLGIHAPA